MGGAIGLGGYPIEYPLIVYIGQPDRISNIVWVVPSDSADTL
jgi:hypothetical protein